MLFVHISEVLPAIVERGMRGDIAPDLRTLKRIKRERVRVDSDARYRRAYRRTAR